MNWVAQLSTKLSKTRQILFTPVGELLRRGDINETLWTDLEEVLLEADVGVSATGSLLSRLRAISNEQSVKDSSKLLLVFREELIRLLGSRPAPIHFADRGPTLILVVGVNGSGKTTTIGKLAAQFKAQRKKVLLGAADTFRAAAIDQLEIWANRAGADLVKHKEGSDPAAVAFDTMKAGNARPADLIILDTAGRLQTKTNLMEELKKIRRVIRKEMPAAPHETLLVIDAVTGQNALNQARVFTEAVDVTGIVLTKLDGTAKGGVLLAIRQELKIPIKFIGVGESVADLQPFDPVAFADALLRE